MLVDLKIDITLANNTTCLTERNAMLIRRKKRYKKVMYKVRYGLYMYINIYTGKAPYFATLFLFYF